MSNTVDVFEFPAIIRHPGATTTGDSLCQSSLVVDSSDPRRIPLYNLSTVQARMDSIQRFLSTSIHTNTLLGKDQMDMVSTEIASSIHQIFVNGADLLSYCSPDPPAVRQETTLPKPSSNHIIISPKPYGTSIDSDMKMVTDLKVESVEEEMSDDCEIIEIDSVELMAEHSHFCEICGKGFKRDANLRMHMRAHGNQFKTPEALAKPEKFGPLKRIARFSCPYIGCNRNKSHSKFRPLKSSICVKNHFKRSHCPKMYSCNRCNKKSFSVVADLKSHLRHCGEEAKWKCSCGTNFSRKDKLFGHVALFQGHMPAVDEEDPMVKAMELGSDNWFFDGLLDGFSSIHNYCLEDVLGDL